MYWSSARCGSVCKPAAPSAQEANRRNIWAQDSLANMKPWVTSLLLWRDTMIKGTYERKHLIGGFLQFQRVRSMTVMAGSRAAAAQNLHLICKLEAEAGPGVGVWSLKAHLPWYTPSKIIPLHSFQTVPLLEIYESTGAILTQTLLTHILRLTEA